MFKTKRLQLRNHIGRFLAHRVFDQDAGTEFSVFRIIQMRIFGRQFIKALLKLFRNTYLFILEHKVITADHRLLSIDM